MSQYRAQDITLCLEDTGYLSLPLSRDIPDWQRPSVPSFPGPARNDAFEPPEGTKRIQTRTMRLSQPLPWLEISRDVQTSPKFSPN